MAETTTNNPTLREIHVEIPADVVSRETETIIQKPAHPRTAVEASGSQGWPMIYHGVRQNAATPFTG